MINYVFYDGFFVKENPESRKEYKTLVAYLNDILRKYLMDLNGYINSVRKNLGLKNKIPLLLSSDICFLVISNLRNGQYLINYLRIKSYSYLNNKVTIVFKDGVVLVLRVSKHIWTNQIKKAEEIIGYSKSINKYFINDL